MPLILPDGSRMWPTREQIEAVSFEIERDAIHRQYDYDHALCPACLSDDYESTTLGAVVLPGGVLKDPNRISCTCGWSGPRWELKSRAVIEKPHTVAETD